jgi:hypothetical protein
MKLLITFFFLLVLYTISYSPSDNNSIYGFNMGWPGYKWNSHLYNLLQTGQFKRASGNSTRYITFWISGKRKIPTEVELNMGSRRQFGKLWQLDVEFPQEVRAMDKDSSLYQTLRHGLIEKYGEPTETVYADSVNHTKEIECGWKRSSMLIYLKHSKYFKTSTGGKLGFSTGIWFWSINHDLDRKEAGDSNLFY